MSSTTNGEDPKSPFPDPTVFITGHNAAGQAIIQSSYAEETKAYSGLRVSHSLLYTTSEFPADLNDDKDLKLHEQMKASGKLNIVNPGGTVIRIVNFAPHNHSMMHRTQSLDYGVVLEGEVIMELDD